MSSQVQYIESTYPVGQEPVKPSGAVALHSEVPMIGTAPAWDVIPIRCLECVWMPVENFTVHSRGEADGKASTCSFLSMLDFERLLLPK